MEDFELDLFGGDLPIVDDSFANTLKDFVQEYILGQLKIETRNSFENVINDMLHRLPTDGFVVNDLLDFNYRLLDEGVVVNDKFVSIIMDGTVTPAN